MDKDNEKKENTQTEEYIDRFFKDISDLCTEFTNNKIDKDTALKKLQALKDAGNDEAGNLNNVYEFAESFIKGDQKGSSDKDGNKNNTPNTQNDADNDKKDFTQKLDELKKETKDNINKTSNTITEQGIHKMGVDAVKQETGYPESVIEEVLAEDDNTADLEEELSKDVDMPEPVDVSDKYKLKRPDREKIKKIYKYKVEGEISTGGQIKDLDNFLKIIQPAINLCIIAAWQPIFKLMDAKTAAEENVANWKKRKKELLKGWETLKVLNPNIGEFSWGMPIEKQEDLMAGYFNKYMCDQMNKNINAHRQETYNDKLEEITTSHQGEANAKALIQKDMDEWEKTEFNAFDAPNRTDLFDDKMPSYWSRYTIDDEFLKLLRYKDAKGNGTRDDKGKLNDMGKN